MYFGFLTLPLGCMPLEQKLEWAGQSGITAAEVACWPRLKEEDRRFSDLDILNFNDADARCIRELTARTGVKISLLACYDNNLDADPDRRAFVNRYTRRCIDAAAAVGAAAVGTFVGRDLSKSIRSNLEDFRRVFLPLVEYAEARGVRLLIENCPQRCGHDEETVGNIAIGPEIWEQMFRIIPSPFFGLNFDPAHLHWQMIDCVAAAREFAPRILHMHAKDVSIYPEKLARYGVSNRLLGNPLAGYWQYRLVGQGDIPWERLIAALRAGGFDGAVSLEHTKVKPEGREREIQADFVRMRNFLAPMVGVRAGQ